MAPTVNWAGLPSSGNKIGQKGADGHYGVTTVPMVLHFCAC